MSIFLQFQDLSSDPDHVRIAILATMTGVFVTRTVVIAKKLASPRF
jgi:hypothetical protein